MQTRTPEQVEAILQTIEAMPLPTRLKPDNLYGCKPFLLVYHRGIIHKDIGFFHVKVLNPEHKSVAPFKPLPNIIPEDLRRELAYILTDSCVSICYGNMPAWPPSRDEGLFLMFCHKDDTEGYNNVIHISTERT